MLIALPLLDETIPPMHGLPSFKKALVDVIHAFTVTPPPPPPLVASRVDDISAAQPGSALNIFVDVATTHLAVKLYASLLLCPEQAVSFAAKSALIRILKPAGPLAGGGNHCTEM